MEKSLLVKVWMLLVLLTISSALVSHNFSHYNYIIAIIIGFTTFKFLGISFFFMELKKAHSFWKAAIIIYLVLFSTIAILIF
ncbi:cytochrome C oxidase subunit IV family protein [Lutibacter sp.]|uniref:cytochrome C oxidase subunit IV family protein n=1 Tax=Lutibacter sp. TaxID=1925666 RepID=UPI0025BE089D|nr:cytochrome C oxidase subunit IV family protein [Lutibacter sp.]MCF6169336.1 cytochrome C oxidase subunit IV family protein [Lutibacter sp.]